MKGRRDSSIFEPTSLVMKEYRCSCGRVEMRHAKGFIRIKRCLICAAENTKASMPLYRARWRKAALHQQRQTAQRIAA